MNERTETERMVKCLIRVKWKEMTKDSRARLTSESAPLSAPGHLNVTYS
jgi:hypothetical protein